MVSLILQHPIPVQGNGEDGGQFWLRPMWSRTEAPRQRSEARESGPSIADRSTWIWLRTGSVYGTPVMRYHATHPINVRDLMKPTPFHPRGRWRYENIIDRCHTVFSMGNHPGERRSLSPGRERPGTQESRTIRPKKTMSLLYGSEVRGVIVVRERESRLHGEGHQPDR